MLTRNSYDAATLGTQLHARPAEIRDFLAGTLPGDRTQELTEQLRAGRRAGMTCGQVHALLTRFWHQT